MRKYLIRRLLLVIPTLFLVSVIIFLMLRTLPGDVAITILYGGGESAPTPEELQKLREDLRLTDPLPVQYFHWISNAARGDLGYSYWTEEPVMNELRKKLALSVELALLALILYTLVAIPTGVISALWQDSWLDQGLRLFTAGGLAMPTFWVGILVLLALVTLFDWIPPLRYISFAEDPLGNISMLIFPALALGYRYVSIVSRITRSMMLEVIREDYVRTARAKGLREIIVVSRHALRNALLPVVTLSSFQFADLLSSAVVIEAVFSLPGLGRHLLQATFARDYITVQAVVLVLATFVIFINLFIDLLYAWLDPRVRYG